MNNPLGSHANVDSICGVYYTFPILPQFLLSNLNYIFIAAYFKTKDQKIYGNEPFLQPLIEKFKKIEEIGLTINAQSGKYQIHFIMSNVLGDNLGLNDILGFTTSFKSNYYCRFCTRNKEEMQYDCVEHADSLRTIVNYNDALKVGDFKLNGVKNNCLFNDLNTFHVTDNYIADIAHDLLEGVCKYDLCSVLKNLISESFFTIESLNYRKQMFNYGETEIGNLSPPLNLHNLKNGQIKMSAREMLTFVHFLPIMIGDQIPETNEVWKFFIILLKIIDRVQSSHFNLNSLEELKILIENHNQAYIKLFKETLKPKFHFLLHYIHIIKQSGPLKYFWSLRYEAKHREAKIYARSITSRKDIAYTLSMKASLKFTSFLQENRNGLPSHIQYKKCDYFNIETYENVKIIVNYCEVKNLFTNNESVNIINYKNCSYKPGYLLTKTCNNHVRLYEVHKIILSVDKIIYLIVKEYEIIDFSEHYQSYIVGTEYNFLNIVKLDEFTGPPIHLYYTPDGTRLVRNKTF